MKKLIQYIIPAAAVLLGAVACEDHRSDHMEDFQTMVYFRNGGEQDLTLFRTGEDGLYQIPVCKSGRNLSGTASAILLPFDQAQMAMYNITNETSYTLLPTNSYAFVDASRNALPSQEKITVNFGSDDAYQVLSLSVNTVAISELQELNPDAEYVMAFQLFSEERVSDNINCIILKPAVEIPRLSLLSPGVESHHYTGSSARSETYRNTVSLNMEANEWDFTVSLEVMDEEWLTAYNNANGTSYKLLPESMYTFEQTEIAFEAGQTEVPFDVTVTREGMTMLTEYALPIRMTACSKEEFELDGSADLYLLNLVLDPDQIPLDETMVSVSQSETYPSDAGGAPALVDGNIATYWHSPWSVSATGDDTYGIYIDIKLKSPLKAIVLRYCTRSGNANGVPYAMRIGISNDGQNWTELGTVSTDAMTGAVAGQWISLPALTADTTFSYVRVGITESASGSLCGANAAYTALSELELYGTNM